MRPATETAANPQGVAIVLPRDEVIAEARRLGFWQRYERNPKTHCLDWRGGRSGGYGVVYLRLGGAKAVVKAHRVAWVIERGEIDPALTVDHRCFNPRCGNVEHMELVPWAENLRRRRAVQNRKTAQNAPPAKEVP